MHSYSTDNSSRPTLLAGLGVVSYGLVRLAQVFFPVLSTTLPFGISVSAPSFAIVFGGVYGVFNHYLWRWRILRFLRIVRVPDFSGSWEGYIETSYEGEIPNKYISGENDPDSVYTRVNASLEIDQRWREIDIHFQTDTSSSDSNAATILINKNMWPSLNYQYENSPEPDTPTGMEMHHGTADLQLETDGVEDVLEGLYYTGPGRENHGIMRFTRIE
jgi:hypothetical protein